MMGQNIKRESSERMQRYAEFLGQVDDLNMLREHALMDAHKLALDLADAHMRIEVIGRVAQKRSALAGGAE